MNLDIPQAWCRHWVRERLDIQPSGSLVLLIVDAKNNGTGLTRKHRQAVSKLTTELRWHFSHPVFVLLSIVDGPLKNDSMSGIIDEHIHVENSTYQIQQYLFWIPCPRLPRRSGSLATVFVLRTHPTRLLVWIGNAYIKHLPRPVSLTPGMLASILFRRPECSRSRSAQHKCTRRRLRQRLRSRGVATVFAKRAELQAGQVFGLYRLVPFF